MESVKENECGTLSSPSTPQGVSDSSGDSNSVKPSGLTPGKRPSIGEDSDGGGAEAKLFGKGLAATSLLQIAIRNGIYQNQVANAIGGAAKNMNIPIVKTANIYSLTSANSTTSVNSLLGRRRQRHKRNLSLGAPPTSTSPGGSSAEAVSPAPSVSPLSTLSLDRKTFLRQKQSKQLQASDKTWVRSDLRRGCIHVHDWLTPSYPRPVLCTVDTTAAELASKLEGSKAGAVLRINFKTAALVDLNDYCKASNGHTDAHDVKNLNAGENEHKQHYYPDAKLSSNLLDDNTASNSSSEVYMNDIGIDLSQSVGDCYGVYSGSDMESSTCEDFSPGGPRSTEHRDSLSDGLGLGTDSSVLSPTGDSATEGPDPFESSSDEVDLTSSPTHSAGNSAADQQEDLPTTYPCSTSNPTTVDEPPSGGGDNVDTAKLIKAPSKCPSSSQTRPLSSQASAQPDPEVPGGCRVWPETINTTPTPALFAQLHGGAVRRLGDDEKPLQILNEYLTNLGFEEAWRVQGESMNPEIGCLIRFYFGKPRSVGGSERVQLSGVFNVRKGKLALPVNRWSRRQVTLSGTCLIVSSVKHAHTGKMHILPLIGGKGVMFCKLRSLSLSNNALSDFPLSLCDITSLTELNLSGNRLSSLPVEAGTMHKLLSSGSLRKLLAGWNQVCRLAERLERSQLEVLDLQHNHLTELPHNLFIKAQSLRYLNVSANKLENLPAASLSEDNSSSLEELYVTNNCLTDKCVPLLTGHGHLRVLHLAYNQLQTFTASKLARLEQLEELDLSGNRLRAVPTTILSCQRMHTLSAHSNCINAFPEVLQLPEIKCVDLSCNELTEVTLPETLPQKLQDLDLTGNPRLNLDHKSLELLNNIKCFRVDPSPSAPCVSESHGAPAVWSHGYTEASGVKNKLCVAALALDSFCGIREALYGVFDGDKNVEVPYLLQCTMGDVLAEELHRGQRQEDYMTNTFLTMQRKLGTAGQRMGGSAALCHIKHDPVAPGERGGCFTLKAANVGRCQAVLCRDGKAMQLSTTHTVKEEPEYLRVRQHNAIITEDNKVSGVTDSTRIMGYSFLCPSVTPRPHVSTVTLTPQDEFFLLGSRGLWDMLSPSEAVEAVRNVPDALAAAKKLVTLAQSYGCSDSLSAVVVQLSITEDCCCFCEPEPPPPSPGPGVHTSTHPYSVGSDGIPLPPASSGTVSELSSEFSTSEMSSEVGSTASSEEPPPQAEPLPSHLNLPGRAGVRRPPCGGGSFHRQFSGALSDHGVDSEDEEPIAGVFSNGSRVEVEADVHRHGCTAPQTHTTPSTKIPPVVASPSPLPFSLPSPSPVPPSSPCLSGEAQSGTLGRRARANGSVACQGRNQDLIEEAADAPVRKQGGYFNAPAQPDPDDQLIIPPELEEEVRQIIQQQQQQQMQTHSQPAHSYQKPADFFVTPL
ncbi:PH domain leucine-rich repeat-containing protein phosphatase 1-like [Notothenia coriiceps]|uniref:PH domain leucine-rich repeat-containing protein phosphatase 1-like n=1 Tax=Notothenia coriiceps TaxID=8208 RepID=A0A6I9Q1J5_9TELE|nr:PREDICTED: PH domain leucine-rich repeat-containing protein phosphatase 1-like [Notothenia coriiceps]